MSLSQADLDRLDAAIASNALSVQIGDRRIQYRTMDELMKAREHVARQIAAAASPQRGASRRFVFSTLRGD